MSRRTLDNWSSAVVLAFVAVGGYAAPVAPQEPAESDDAVVVDAPVVALIGVRVIDGTGRPPAEDQVVVVENGSIRAVGSSHSVSIPDGAHRLDRKVARCSPGS